MVEPRGACAVWYLYRSGCAETLSAFRWRRRQGVLDQRHDREHDADDPDREPGRVVAVGDPLVVHHAQSGAEEAGEREGRHERVDEELVEPPVLVATRVIGEDVREGREEQGHRDRAGNEEPVAHRRALHHVAPGFAVRILLRVPGVPVRVEHAAGEEDDGQHEAAHLRLLGGGGRPGEDDDAGHQDERADAAEGRVAGGAAVAAAAVVAVAAVGVCELDQEKKEHVDHPG